MFVVLNADGVKVAEYEFLAHAIDSAETNAKAAAYEDPSNFYTVANPDGSSVECDEQTEFMAKDYEGE